MTLTTEYILSRLMAEQDPGYRDFHAKLIPNVDKSRVIGVRTPVLRSLAKELSREGDMSAFLAELPHGYYEENNLHGILLSEMKDYDACVSGLDRFLPYVDNWATCDIISPKSFKKHPPELPGQAEKWIRSGDTYTIRFGMETLMSFYLDSEFRDEYPALVASVRSEQYYVRMMQAWYFATALAKQYDAVLPYLLERRLEVWTHNKTIQKARESFRISQEQKEYLGTLKR